MCGVAGSLDLRTAAPDSESIVAAMIDTVAHRGPDDAGLLVDPPCVLGHRRLSIIDLSSAGHQPMPSADGSLWISFNGEIYNYLEVRAELEQLGRSFSTRTDTEVLLQAYAQWGEHALSRLNGMFAFVLWDRRARRLLLVRDRFGVKPLYYAVADGRFLFASEIKALLVAPGVRREPNAARIRDFLAWAVLDHTEETLFAGIHQLRPGTYLAIDAGANAVPEPTVWYEPQPHAARGDAAATVRALLESSVDLRLRSDVPVGVALSGGMDSSSVLSISARIRSAHGLEPPMSFSARSTEYDEFKYSESLVRSTGSRNAQVLPRGEELQEEFDGLLWHMDEPVHNGSVYAHRKLLELARGHGTIVLLDGTGGDEAFAGYHHVHYQAMLLELLRSGKLRTLLSEIGARRRTHETPYLRIVKDMLKPAVPARIRPHTVPAWVRHPSRVELRRLPQPSLIDHQRHALAVSPLPYYNHFNDRNSMAVSVEARSPFLDFRIIEAGLGLEVPDLLHQGISKWALRQAMRDLLPREIVERVDKQGFTADESHWLRGSVGDDVDHTFRSKRLAVAEFVDGAAVRSKLIAHRAGEEWADEIWRAYALERWFQLFITPPALQRPPRPAGAPVPVPLTPEKIVRLSPSTVNDQPAARSA